MGNNFFISSGSRTITTYPDSELKVYSVPNVKIGAEYDGYPVQNFYGNIFVFQIMEISFFHFINDVVGQYEILKELIPDLRPVFVFGSMYDYGQLAKDKPAINEILEDYGMCEENVFPLSDYHHAELERVFYLHNNYSPSLAGKKPLLPLNYGESGFFEYQNKSISRIVDKFKEFQQPGSPTKKIFITRKKENDKLRRFREIINNQINNKLPSTDDELFFNKYSEFKSLRIDEAIKRYIHSEDELEIEKYFSDNGYEIVDPGTLSYRDQVFLYSSATHIAGIAGAGIYNTIHCKPEANVFIINVSDGYDFWHEYFPKSATKNVFHIPKTDNRLKRFFNAKTIISAIEESNEYAI